MQIFKLFCSGDKIRNSHILSLVLSSSVEKVCVCVFVFVLVL